MPKVNEADRNYMINRRNILDTAEEIFKTSIFEQHRAQGSYPSDMINKFATFAISDAREFWRQVEEVLPAIPDICGNCFEIHE